MREILFRGKRIDNGKWIEGYLLKCPSAVQIGDYSPWYISIPPVDPDDNGGLWNVDPATVGQYTGLKGMNGQKMFEDDIVRYRRHTGVINFTLGCFCIRAREKDMFGRSNPAIDIIVNEYPNEIEVIGNIHDNPDLVERSDHDGK